MTATEQRIIRLKRHTSPEGTSYAATWWDGDCKKGVTGVTPEHLADQLAVVVPEAFTGREQH